MEKLTFNCGFILIIYYDKENIRQKMRFDTKSQARKFIAQLKKQKLEYYL